MTRLWRQGFLAVGVLIPAVGIALAVTHRGQGDERFLLARTSVDGRWSPCGPPAAEVTGYCRPPEKASRVLEPWQDRSRGRENFERIALASLFFDRGPDRLDRVISRFEAATRKTPNDAKPFTDLAAAQLTFGWAEGSAESFIDALESADRALEIDPADARACFNRALALEELGLRELALDGWESCAQLETDPEWRFEILERAEALRSAPTAPSRPVIAAAVEKAVREDDRAELARIARDHPHLATDLVLRDLLPQWMGAGPIEPLLPSLEALAEGIGQETEDRLLADAVLQIRSGLTQGRGPEIAEGVRRLRYGLDAYRERLYEEAVPRLQASADHLQAVPALQALARTYGAVALESSGRVDAARQELLRLVAEAGAQRYGWLLGIAHWTLGRMAIKEGSPLGSAAHYREALLAFESARAGDLVLSTRILLAESYSELGQADQAWELGREALLDAHRLGASDRLFFVLNLLAGIADEQERSGLALYTQTSALHYAAGEPPSSRANAYLARAYLLGRRGLHEQALADLRRAEELAGEVVDPSEKASLEADFALVQGVLSAQTAPEAATVQLEKAIRLFDQTGDRFARLVALKARSEALRTMDRAEEAITDLEEATALYEVTVRNLSEGDENGLAEMDRLSYLRQNAEVYQAMVGLYANELRDPEMALLVAEHAKALRAPGPLPEISLDESQIDRWCRALPTGTALLSYSTAGEHVVAWLLTPESRQFVRLGRLDEISTLAGRLDRARDSERWEALSRELHRRLVAPLTEALRPVRRLLVVPSPGLDRVPFPGLLDASGRYLAETHLIEMLPCASALLRGAALQERPVQWRRAVVVGDPKPTSAGLLGLPLLRFAEREARDAEAFLGPANTVLLLGPEATPRRLLDEAAAADLIHVASHAVSLGRGPDAAALVLATGAGDEEGLLRAREILGHSFDGTRLVVLSACSSAGGPAGSWQSGLTLARSFLSAGAERVIATLRAVDDEESARLFQTFYRELALGRDAAASLRTAQLETLRWRRQTERTGAPTWPFVVILDGGPSN